MTPKKNKKKSPRCVKAGAKTVEIILAGRSMSLSIQAAKVLYESLRVVFGPQAPLTPVTTCWSSYSS